MDTEPGYVSASDMGVCFEGDFWQIDLFRTWAAKIAFVKRCVSIVEQPLPLFVTLADANPIL